MSKVRIKKVENIDNSKFEKFVEYLGNDADFIRMCFKRWSIKKSSTCHEVRIKYWTVCFEFHALTDEEELALISYIYNYLNI